MGVWVLGMPFPPLPFLLLAAQGGEQLGVVSLGLPPPSNPVLGWLVPSPGLRALASSFPQDDWWHVCRTEIFSGKSVAHEDIKYEQACILYNLGEFLTPSPWLCPLSPASPGAQLSSRP